METPAWLLKGLFFSSPGTLKLRKDTLTLALDSGEIIFTLSLSNPYEIRFPWYYFGAGLVLTIEGKRYRISFIQQGEDGDIRTGIQNGKAWRERLTTAQ